MASYVNFSFSSTKQRSIAIGAVALVATLITIGIVVTITIKHGSSSTNNLLIKSEFKVKFDEPQWVRFVDKDTSLVNAFVGGTNARSSSIYVCRVNSTKSRALELLPGMFDPDSGISACEVTWGDDSYRYYDFDILVAKDPSVLVWESDTYGDAPIGALSGGISEMNDELQISRADINSGQYIGKVHGRHSRAYVAYGSRERTVRTYQVLCLQDYSLG
ncbi:uncharacterized protein LOC107366074 [Tetranychus urticae]|uniref:Uncharacterized protein n=1 Tax=Tetranychus urticae TaxID=32264 RepID=T1KQA2_TETUR|nr:uncharacterized protein LOC107366074 [Tetranychus urticae]